MKLIVETLEDGVTVLSIGGALDSSNAREFGDRVQTLLDDGQSRLIFDATTLTAISSLGVAVLLRVHRQMKPLEGELKFVNFRGTAGDVIALFQFDKVFAIYPDVEQARQAFVESNPQA